MTWPSILCPDSFVPTLALMKLQTIGFALALVLGLMAFPSAAQAATADDSADSAQAALAEILADLAGQSVHQPQPSAHDFRRSVALLKGAIRLNPSEPRYSRLLVEAMLRLGDAPGALEALAAYRKLEPDRPGIQIQVIDLYLDQMQTADARLQYLAELLEKPSLPKEVRSHAALRKARLLLERSQVSKAREVLGRAIELNPLNVEALRLQYELLDPSAAPEQRVAALVPLIEANPAQLDAVLSLAEELALAGLSEQSLEFYEIAMNLTPRLGVPFEQRLAHGYAEQLLRTGRTPMAESALSNWLSLRPEDVDAWFMRLIASRRSRKPEDAQKISRSATVAMLNVLANIQKEAGDESATTRPVEPAQDVAIPDTRAAVERIRSAGHDELLAKYAAGLVDLAWFEIYFEKDPSDAGKLIDVLRGLLDERSVTLARLEGWRALVQGNAEEASTKLAPIAGHDALAALGMARLDGPTTAPLGAAALAKAHPAGITGLLIWDALLADGGQPAAPHAPGVARVLEKLDRKRLEILEQPGDFYLVRGDPLKVAHGFGEPILVKVTVQNVSRYDLSMGPDGILRPDLWFNAELRGLVQENLVGTAFDRVAKQRVLPAHGAVSQIVRLDQGPLAQFLRSNPTVSVPIFFSVMTNPTSVPQGVAPGPAGQVIQFTKIVERKGTPVFGEGGLSVVGSVMATGTEAEKIRILDLLATAAQAAGAQEATKATAASIADLIEETIAGNSDWVGNWARFLSAIVRQGPQRTEAAQALADGDNWLARLLAAVVAPGLAPEQRRPLVNRLATDVDAIVADYARTLLAEMEAPTTQPSATTKPATAPATQPLSP